MCFSAEIYGLVQFIEETSGSNCVSLCLWIDTYTVFYSIYVCISNFVLGLICLYVSVLLMIFYMELFQFHVNIVDCYLLTLSYQEQPGKLT
jgi:hypothetical protein